MIYEGHMIFQITKLMWEPLRPLPIDWSLSLILIYLPSIAPCLINTILLPPANVKLKIKKIICAEKLSILAYDGNDIML